MKYFLSFFFLFNSVHYLQAQSDTIPFVLTDYNNIKIQTVVNGKDSLELKFDSGTTGLLLTHDAIKDKTDLLQKNQIEQTENYQKLGLPVSLKFGNQFYDSLEVYPVMHSGQGTDGRFGWDLFKGKVLEIDYDESLFIVHDSLPQVSGAYSKIPFAIDHTLICIPGKFFQDRFEYTVKFLFDSGYQKSLLVDSTLASRQGYSVDLPVLKVNRLRNGAGEIFETKVVEVQRVGLGEISLNQIPAQIINQSNPAGFDVHILGNDFLKRYNTIFDFQHQMIYLAPNSLISDPFATF
ncbi:MAG: retroviral-like aspartic protease family protein [Saprospiraceae bacterium]